MKNSTSVSLRVPIYSCCLPVVTVNSAHKNMKYYYT